MFFLSKQEKLCLFELLDEKHDSGYLVKKRVPHFGSFYLRLGAISFGIGTMVYSGLEFGQYFEMNSEYLLTLVLNSYTLHISKRHKLEYC